jgi:hypothetical protein
MLLTSLITAAEETHNVETISPLGVGGVALGVLLAMLVALLMFGKGREHS